MEKYCVLYNSKTHHKKGFQNAKRVEKKLPNASFTYKDSTQIEDIRAFIDALPEDTGLIFTGGDGTLNYMINALDGYELKRPLFFFPAGSGNDFINDLGKTTDCEPFLFNPYMEHLPTVTVNGIKRKFINGVSLGMDGFVCEEKDRLAALGRDLPYKLIAVQSLLYKYQKHKAKVTIDGGTYEYDDVWMVPTMFGSFYGGGVKICPMQRRDDPEHMVTMQVVFDCKRLRTMMIFPDITAGKCEKYPQYIHIFRGRHVEVEFDSPTALQIDGEVISNVTRYVVDAGT